MINRMELLRIIQNDARLTPDNIAIMLDCDVAEVEAEAAKVVATNGVITITYNTKVENNKTLIMSPTNAQGSIKWDCTSTAANTVAAKYRPATCRP